MTIQQLVEIRPIAAGQAGGLGHVARRDLQDLAEIIPGELVPGILELRQTR